MSDISFYLSRGAFWIVVPLAHCGDAHQTPPETLIEAPVCLPALLGEIHETWEGEDTDTDEHHQQEDFLVDLAKCGQQALEPGEMLNELKTLNIWKYTRNKI